MPEVFGKPRGAVVAGEVFPVNFVSLTFAIMLVVVFALHWAGRSRAWRNGVLLVASYIFYGFWDWRFCGLLFFTSTVDFLISGAISIETRVARRRWLLATNCAISLGILGVFKYYDFFVLSFERAALALGWTADLPLLQVVLPVGISFYTFQSLAYLIDVYRGHVTATRDYLGFLAYVSFFPQLVAGPIERAPSLLPQILGDRVFSGEAARNGLRQMLYGFFVKVAIADNLALFVEQIYGTPSAFNGAKLLFATVCFAFQIYWDFSGYSHIATGTAKLFGVQLMQNFRYPYLACDIRDFWRRWHISLSTWFRDYVYIPLGGSRGTFGKTLALLMTTFVISGLWHGASWNFVIWGVWHGGGMVGLLLWERRPGATRGAQAGWLRRGVGWVATMAFVLIGWVWFRCQDMGQASEVFSGIFCRFFEEETSGQFVRHRFGIVPLVFAAAAFVAEWARRGAAFPLDWLDRAGWPVWARWSLYATMIWVALFYRNPGADSFIYFQF